MTGKQKQFVSYYLQTFNATEAARRAGYDGDDVTLASVGYENLRKPQIAKTIAARLAETAMSADEVLQHLAAIARGDVEKSRVSDRLRALELIGKHFLLFVDQHEINANSTSEISVVYEKNWR